MSSHSFRRRLFFLAPAIVCALPQPSTPTLPQSLQPLVPTCSWSCLSSFIQSSFPSSICTDRQDIDCLCSHAGTEGFNLEEGAFVCAHQNCPSVSDSTINSTYSICSGRPNAVQPTHTILPTTFTAKPNAMSTPTTSNGAPTTGPSAMTAPAKPVSSQKHQLNTSQIVGISVSGAAVVLIAIAVAIFLLCLRRRRQHRLKLDSDPLPYEEFKRPPQALNSSGRSSPASLVKDPRGGVGGVGVAPCPVRYKAIHPPSQLFLPVFYPENPDDVGKSVAPNTNAGSPQHSTRMVPPPTYTTNRAQSSPEPARSQSPPAPSQAVPRVAVASPPASGNTLLVPTKQQRNNTEPSTRRNPSLLLPAKPDMAVLPNERPYSVTSQTTQFEEDLQSPTIPLKINNMTIYPMDSSSSGRTTPSSSEEVYRNKNDRVDRRKSRGPLLRISIPGKGPGPAPTLPPPPPRGANNRALQRPHLAAAGVAGLPFPPPPPPPRTAQRQVLPPVQPYSAASTSSSSIPLQFPLPPSSKPGAVAESTHTEQFRSDSVSRRGFSQPHTTAFQAARHQPGTVPSDYAGPFTVNGERINYPNIPRPSPPANSNNVPYPANFTLPPPPPRLPAVIAQFGPASNRSSEDTALSNGSRISAVNSLLAKRRGSDRAATLEKQLYINRSNFGNAEQTEYAPGASPQQFRGAGHGRIDSKGVVSPDMGTGTSFGSNPHSATSPWMSRENNYARGQPAALQTTQGNVGRSQPYGAMRWASPASGNSVAGGVRQQYVPYYPPPPPRPAPKNTEGAQWSPSPTRMTPTRRGADLFLSVS